MGRVPSDALLSLPWLALWRGDRPVPLNPREVTVDSFEFFSPFVKEIRILLIG